MRGLRRGATATPAALVCAALLGSGHAAAAPVLSGERLPASKLPGFVGCRSFVSRSAKAIVRPRSVIVACGDGNFYVTGLRWAQWTATEAIGRGTGHLNDCDPNCAAGHFHAFRVSLRLGRPRRCGTRHDLQLTGFSWSFIGPKPQRFARYGVERFRCA